MELINEISWGPDELTNCPGVVGRAELKDPLLGVAIPLGELKAAAAAAANDDDDFEEFKYKFIDDEDNDGDIELALLEAEAPDVDVDDRDPVILLVKALVASGKLFAAISAAACAMPSIDWRRRSASV